MATEHSFGLAAKAWVKCPTKVMDVELAHAFAETIDEVKREAREIIFSSDSFGDAAYNIKRWEETGVR